MWLYYCLILFIWIFSIALYKRYLIYQERTIGRDEIFLFCSMGILLLLNCLRSLNTGNDTISYYKLFNYYISGHSSESYSRAGFDWMDSYVDIGWRYLNIIFGKLSDNYQIFISVIAIFLYITIIKYIKKYSTNLAISVLLFFLMFYHPYLNVLRQAVAISIILLGVKFLTENKIWKFILFVLVASLFHKYAIISLILILFVKVKYNKGISRLIILGSFILSLTGAAVIIPALFGYTGGYLTDSTGISTVFSFILQGIIFLSMQYITTYSLVDNEENAVGYDMYNFYQWINLTAFALSILEMALPAMYRVEYFFSIYQIVGIPYLLSISEREPRTKGNILKLILITLIVYQTGIFIFRPEWITDFPYHFYWIKGV